MKDELIRMQVRESIKQYVNGGLVAESSSSSMNLTESLYQGGVFSAEDAPVIAEALETVITEGKIQDIIGSLDRYPMMFLENGDHRYFFVKTGKGIEWVEFKGNSFEDKGVISDLAQGESFVEDLKASGFTPIKNDGGVKKFFKAIGRGLAVFLRVTGWLNIIGAIIAVIVLSIGALTAMIPLTIMTMLGIGAGVAVVDGFARIGAGWLIAKPSKKKAEMPQMAQG